MDKLSSPEENHCVADANGQPPGHVHQIHFGESAWSFPLVLGLATAGPWDVSFALLLLFLNLGMQVAFSVIIMTEERVGPFHRSQPCSVT
eukprot:g12288.t1